MSRPEEKRVALTALPQAVPVGKSVESLPRHAQVSDGIVCCGLNGVVSNEGVKDLYERHSLLIRARCAPIQERATKQPGLIERLRMLLGSPNDSVADWIL